MQEESEKFLLLPPCENGPDIHDRVIFESSEGDFNDRTERVYCDLNPSILEARNATWCNVVQRIVGNP